MKTYPTSVKNVVLFPVMETDTISVNNVVIFSVMETDYSTPLIFVFSETLIQQKHLPNSVKNAVIFFSNENRYHFSKQWGSFFSSGDRLLEPFN